MWFKYTGEWISVKLQVGYVWGYACTINYNLYKAMIFDLLFNELKAEFLILVIHHQYVAETLHESDDNDFALALAQSHRLLLQSAVQILKWNGNL